MDGNAVAGAMTVDAPVARGGVVFSLAGAGDDADLRRLLRENPMAGNVSLSLEREPSVFHAAAVEGDEHHVILARDRESGRAVAMGSMVVRERFINGSPQRVGYLGQLRLDRAWRGRGDLLRTGYRFLRERHGRSGVSLYFTSIVTDNRAARKFLEAGLPGMPKYRPIEPFTTLLIPRSPARRCTRRPPDVEPGSYERLPEIADCLNRNGRHCQFHPAWTAPQLASPVAARGLRPEDFRLAVRNGRIVGCLALWRQESFKQIVVRGYAAPLRLIRPIVNAGSRLLGRTPLPPVGAGIPHAYVSHVAVDDDNPVVFDSLIRHARSAPGIDPGTDPGLLVLGFSQRHPLLGVLRGRGFRTYDSMLYAVHWDDAEDAAARLDGRVAHPEVALI